MENSSDADMPACTMPLVGTAHFATSFKTRPLETVRKSTTVEATKVHSSPSSSRYTKGLVLAPTSAKPKLSQITLQMESKMQLVESPVSQCTIKRRISDPELTLTM